MEAPVVYRDKDITEFTTFGIPVKAKLFAEYENARQLTWLSRQKEFTDNEVLHIGGGSNLLFIDDFNGLVLHSRIRGIVRYDKDQDTVFAIAGAGEKWTDFVDWCVLNGLSGLENLAGIPGEVGASAVQNVGAYGVEAKDVIHNVECFDTENRQVVNIKGADCGFGYRDSRFKGEWKGRYIVLRVSFRLKPSDKAESLDYGPLRSLAAELGKTPTIAEVRQRILQIRGSKLPDPEKEGSAGSFFKNPVVPEHYYRKVVLMKDPEVPCYDLGNGYVKIPAGWLIEHAGLKDRRIGGARVYPGQCLVISNCGNATAADVYELAETVRRTVRDKYAVDLSKEVNYIDTDIKVEVLGSGTSKGVPEVGCGCEVCRSDDSRDKRLRASVFVQTHGMNIMIDASPDMREQLLRSGIDNIDALLLTHIHYDHIGGMEDLRPFCSVRPFPVYARKDVINHLKERLGYCFAENPYPGVPRFDMHEVGERPFRISGLEIIPVSVMHGLMPIVGYRIGKFAYITDAKKIEEGEKEKLTGLDVLVLNALRDKDHFAHLTIQEALDLIVELKPKRAYLTHLCHEAGFHRDLEKRLPENVRPAYDGLVIECK